MVHRSVVVNPFKEEQSKWVYYGSIGIISLLLTYVFVFVGDNNSVPTPTTTTTHQQLLRHDSGAGSGSGSGDENEEEEQDWTDDRAGVDVNENENENDDFDEEDEDFPILEQKEYLPWLRKYYQALEFDDTNDEYNNNHHRHKFLLNSTILSESLSLGCDYIAANQNPKVGNFQYQYDFVKRKLDHGDSPVRQAGALWGMTLCYQSHPNNEKYKRAVQLGIGFFVKHTIDGPTIRTTTASNAHGRSAKKTRMIQYPNGYDDRSQSGVNALFGLSIIDYIRTVRDNDNDPGIDTNPHFYSVDQLLEVLDGTIQFLLYMQNEDHHFSSEYDITEQMKTEESSPYYDGEIMLCLVKCAKYIYKNDQNDYDNNKALLVPIIEETVPVLLKSYTVDVWRYEHDSDVTKGFYQWSSMFCEEYYTEAEWKDYEYYGDYVLVAAHWIIHTHRILFRKRNTG